jgi:hypothetical protein
VISEGRRGGGRKKEGSYHRIHGHPHHGRVHVRGMHAPHPRIHSAIARRSWGKHLPTPSHWRSSAVHGLVAIPHAVHHRRHPTAKPTAGVHSPITFAIMVTVSSQPTPVPSLKSLR